MVVHELAERWEKTATFSRVVIWKSTWVSKIAQFWNPQAGSLQRRRYAWTRAPSYFSDVASPAECSLLDLWKTPESSWAFAGHLEVFKNCKKKKRHDIFPIIICPWFENRSMFDSVMNCQIKYNDLNDSFISPWLLIVLHISLPRIQVHPPQQLKKK